MSEREANERRKIKRGSISGLANTTMKGAASQDGQGPAEKQPDPNIPAKDTVPQQADASQEGQGPEEPETKAAVPQQADASQEGQRPQEPEEDTDSDRVREIVTLLKDAIDSDGQSDKQIDVLARNLAEQKRVLLRKAATRIAEVEAKTEVAVDQFTNEIVGFLESLTQTLKESNAQKGLERARKTQDAIVMRYWDQFVAGVHGMYQAKLDETKRKIQTTLNATTDDFSRQIAALFQKSLRQIQSPVVPFRQRIFRERRLLAGTLVLGLLLGSFLGTLGETLWNRAGLTGRQTFGVFAPLVVPLSGRTPQ